MNIAITVLTYAYLYFLGSLIVRKFDKSNDELYVSNIPIKLFYPLISLFIIGNLTVIFNFFLPLKTLILPLLISTSILVIVWVTKIRTELFNLNNFVKIAHSINKIPVAYSISNLVISSSIEPEAFGRVSVEAQSMEKPILASNIGGSTETIIPEKTGWLFKSESPSELANSIEMIKKMDKKILDSVGRQGRKNVLDNYSKDTMCSKTLEIYESLV